MTKLEKLKENIKPFIEEKERIMKQNIEEFLKYDKRGVLYKNKDGSWTLTNKVDKLCHDKIYIQNDNYVNIRKAIADGYVIKYNCGEEKCLEIDEYAWDPTRRFYLVSDSYKITKQKRFQQGDWFVFVQDPNQLMMVTEINEYNSNCLRRDGKVIKWEPKVSEWCVFWNDDAKEYFIGRYGFNAISPTFGTPCDEIDIAYTKLDWDNVAPLNFVEYFKEEK